MKNMKNKVLIPFFLSLLFPFLGFCNPLSDPKSTSTEVKKADDYYDATLFHMAIPLYQQLLTKLHANTEERAWVRLRLAKSFFIEKQYPQTLEVLSEIENKSKPAESKQLKTDLEGIFLLGATHNKMEQHEQSSHFFLHYLSQGDRSSLPNYDNALFELGIAYFSLKKYDKAKETLEKFVDLGPKTALSPLSRFYLARIAIAESDFSHAETLIQQLSHSLFKDNPLQYALSFLRGEIAYSRGDFKQAVPLFIKAIPKKNPELAKWYGDTLYYLGWSYFSLGQQGQNDGSDAEKTFRKLLAFDPSDKNRLSLGQCLLLKGKELGDMESLKELETLFSEKTHFNTRSAQHHALLLRAEAASSYQERKKFFKQLTHQNHWDSPYFANAWYLRGVNELEEGQRLIESREQESAKRHLDEAILAFEKSAPLLIGVDKKLAALALKYQVRAYLTLDSREGYLKGLSLLSQILNQYRDELFPLLEEPDEIYYLQGLTAAKLLEQEENKTFYQISESSLIHTIESYPKGSFQSESLKLLGTLYLRNSEYEKGEKTFLTLARLHPPSILTPDAWFWAAHCSDYLEGGKKRSEQYRKKVYELYPNSPLAAEAYFRFYRFPDYLKGDPKAIAHLKEMETRYPESPYCINSHYLSGLEAQNNREDYQSAIEFFLKAIQTFDQLSEKKGLPEEELPYFTQMRYRALLEAALCYITTSDLENGENLLHNMYADFQENRLPSTEFDFSSLQEECNYQLGKTYIQMNRTEAAEQIFTKMLENYSKAKISRGYYLSRCWYEQGVIANLQKEHELALTYFFRSEDAGKGKILTTDELLDLWIQKSASQRGLQKMDEAMLILSQVINYDAVSMQRLKAMYLRAEIYEEQGRLELARRQLEATAKMGGQWAAKAKEKLEKNYVYQ